MSLRCVQCGSKFPLYPSKIKCDKCEGPLEYDGGLSRNSKVKFSGQLRFWRYKPLLPPVRHMVSLGEGGTPLHKAERLAKSIGLKELYLKDETRNPTNSYRDRAAALLISNAIDLHHTAVVCASNGNMGASLSAYSAKAGLTCHVIVPKLVDVGKLAQMLAYDAVIEEFGELLDDSIRKAQALAKETGWYQATAELNPLSIEAQKTISYEISEQLGVPDWLIVSIGSGGTIYSLWKGFKELKQLGIIKSLPKMVGVQPEGCASIVKTLTEKRAKVEKARNPSTRALAILVAEPLQGELAIKALRESNGLALTVSDAEIFAAELQIAKLEGIFAEPASSTTIAALKKLVEEGKISKTDNVVSLITGSGLKATDVLQALTKKQKTAVLGLELSTKEKILRALYEKDTYGYDLWKKLGKTMTRAAIYQHLNELSEKGLITGYEKERKRFFKITQRGKKVLHVIDAVKLLL
ncbi:MAG: threonine synthase [Candidatus Bathyarchaeota archaeon]|nr:threonine synthase [Candidatus Bathyarchaeota archaeon A05DMB-5]MDH7557667.1 threonine synthase [Candidatus Bathyarchaeota archaeon]